MFEKEIMTEIELNNVSGGTAAEYQTVYNILHEGTYIRARDNDSVLKRLLNKLSNEIKSEFGVTATLDVHKPNKYSKNGKSLTHKQFMEIVRAKYPAPEIEIEY